jgi:hypothetical protein
VNNVLALFHFKEPQGFFCQQLMIFMPIGYGNRGFVA